MVRKNYKWNISKEEGGKIINEKITEVLSRNGEMEIADIYFFIQTRCRDITIENNNKKKNLNNFIKNVFGGLRNFLESSGGYKITINGNKVMVDIKRERDEEDIYFLNDWVIVD